MKNIILTCSLALSIIASYAQTAPDFTAPDCDGTSHNLYGELASGKVIVLDWVMPCTSCIGPSLTAYNIVQSYSTSNPGQVLFYLIDDAANTSCLTLGGWAINNNIAPYFTSFSTASIVENDYGGIGMPHIAVVGAGGHMYFNALNGDAGNATGIQNAINSALSANGINEQAANDLKLMLSPNPVTSQARLDYFLKEASAVTIEVLNEAGQCVASYTPDHQTPGKHDYSFETKSLANGNYFVRFSSGNVSRAVKCTVIHE